jgi:hypothetical protein
MCHHHTGPRIVSARRLTNTSPYQTRIDAGDRISSRDRCLCRDRTRTGSSQSPADPAHLTGRSSPSVASFPLAHRRASRVWKSWVGRLSRAEARIRRREIIACALRSGDTDGCHNQGTSKRQEALPSWLVSRMAYHQRARRTALPDCPFPIRAELPRRNRSPAYVAFPSAKSRNPRRANAGRHITRAAT